MLDPENVPSAGRVYKALDRKREEDAKRMAENGERPLYGGGGMKPVSSF